MRAFVAAQPWLEVAYLPVSWEHEREAFRRSE
jgi:hypothetical protein